MYFIFIHILIFELNELKIVDYKLQCIESPSI